MNKPQNRLAEKNKLFTLPTLFLSLIGLALNIGLARLVRAFQLPIFLDSIGTVISAALGGIIPGILVGFLSNAINSIGDPITLYYGLISVIMAVFICEISRAGLLKKWWGFFIAAGVLAVCGGVLGSVLTWLLYGYNIGSGISAPLAIKFYEDGLSLFGAQFSADVIIDIIDKLITMLIVFFFLWFYPKALYKKFPLSYIYDKQYSYKDCIIAYKQSFSFKKKIRSLRYKILMLVLITAIVLSALSLTIGMMLYSENIKEEYSTLCSNVADMVEIEVDGNRVDDYLVAGAAAHNLPDYEATEKQLSALLQKMEKVEYVYVYRVEDDGVHVVFDIDTPDLEGRECGVVFDTDDSFEQYIPDLLAGKGVGPLITNDTYGWLLTTYKPILNSEGNCVAFACADVNMNDISTKNIEYFIRLFTILFTTTIIIVIIVLWFGDRKIVNPINKLVQKSQSFDEAKNSHALSSYNTSDLIPISTGDEIEELYHTICQSESEIIGYVGELTEINRQMSLLQQNTILSFAEMVESRDKTTGDHIFRTSHYVEILCNLMKDKPEYAQITEMDEWTSICKAAPLHDIGKIAIPDSILNKEGRLTAEEFSLMKTHTVKGEEIIKSTLKGINNGGYLETAMDMAKYHHERWDGTGYPCGLAAVEIPLSARIMAVADVFDALVSKRSYKEPFSFEKACNIIREESGTHFDPSIVAVFLSNLDYFKIQNDNL